MAKLLILLGAVLLILGVVLSLFPNALSWFGKLPGDISHRSADGSVRIYFPIVTMIVISLVLSILLNVFLR